MVSELYQEWFLESQTAAEFCLKITSPPTLSILAVCVQVCVCVCVCARGLIVLESGFVLSRFRYAV